MDSVHPQPKLHATAACSTDMGRKAHFLFHNPAAINSGSGIQDWLHHGLEGGYDGKAAL